MYIRYISIFLGCFIKILVKCEYPGSPDNDRFSTTRKPNGGPLNNPAAAPSPTSPEPCRGEGCRRPPNLVAPIVGSLCGILAVALIAAFIIWFYLRHKNKKRTKENVKVTAAAIKYIEQPPLYTGAISTTDSTSNLYGASSPPYDSNDTHYYEKIHYNE